MASTEASPLADEPRAWPRIAWLAAFVVYCALGALLAHDVGQSRDQAFIAAQRELDNLGNLLEKQLTARTDKIDVVLREVVHDYTPLLDGTRPLALLEANRDLLRRESALPETQARSLRIVDARGKILFNAGPDETLPEMQIGDRDYFLRQKNDSLTQLLLSEPFLSGLSDTWLITLNRRINRPDGRFAGIVQTTLPISFYQRLLEGISLSENGTIALISGDYRLLASLPPQGDSIGQAVDMPRMRAALQAGNQGRSAAARFDADGTPNLRHYRQVGTLPLLLAIDLAADDLLATWKQKAALTIIGWLAFGALLLAVILLAERRSKEVGELERRLTEQSAEAEAASQAKSAFLASMGHEIRPPLNAIIGLTHLLRRDRTTPTQTEKLIRIAGAADHLLAVINDILDLSKIEAGNVKLEVANFSPDEMLQRICNSVVRHAQAKGLELVVDTGDLPPILHGDVTRLGQALLNYLGNAVKCTDHGSIVLRAGVEEEGEQDLLVRFEVQDSGSGLAEEDIPGLFAAFAQTTGTCQRRQGGIGLGLAITRHLACLMNGEVGASSAPGQGSTFWMTARLGKAHQEPVVLEPELTGRRALVADDLQITQMVHTHLLTQIGLTPQAVASGKEAVTAIAQADAENDPYSIVLLDLLMPDQSGVDTLAAIQRLPLQRPPVCILVTASGDSSIAMSARAAGFAGVLVKPINKAILQKAISPHFMQGRA